jgi:hypothetical protein
MISRVDVMLFGRDRMISVIDGMISSRDGMNLAGIE